MVCYIDERYYVGCSHLHDRVIVANCDPGRPEFQRTHETSYRQQEIITKVPFIGPQYCDQCMPAKVAEVGTYLEQEAEALLQKEQWKGCYRPEELEKYRRDLMEEVEDHVWRLYEPNQELLQLGLYNPSCY
jgi:hypothetical protein